MNAPASARASVESLAAYLVKPAKNDREKARAIFRWIAGNIDYNMEAFFKGGGGAAGAEDVLKSGKSVCYGYSDLFLSLAGEAGLEAARISGYGKGYGYLPGKNFSGPSNHAWNGVKINGSWYLIDSTWGAGYVNGEGKYVRKFDDHFFMTPPSQFIYDHFPEEDRWQLLDEPVSKLKFENMVYLQSDFFNLGLELAGQENGTINADGQVNLSIYAPDDVLMMAGLEYADGGTSREALDRYTFCQRDGDRYDIYAQFPVAGSYILKAYAKAEVRSRQVRLGFRIPDQCFLGRRERRISHGLRQVHRGGGLSLQPHAGQAEGGGELPFQDQGAWSRECVCGKRGGMEPTGVARGSVRRECDCGEGRCGGVREV